MKYSRVSLYIGACMTVAHLTFPTDFTQDENGIWVSKNTELLKHHSLEGDTPLCLRDPNKMRIFDPLDWSSLLRFWISTNWMRKQFETMAKAGIKRRPRVLDLGCANLQAYHIWHNQGNYFGWPQIDYYGVDVNYKRLMVGKKVHPLKKSDRVTLIQSNLEYPLHFVGDDAKKMRFDYAVCMEFLEHIPKESFAMIMKTLVTHQLTKTGTAILSSPNPLKSNGEEVVWKKMSPISHIYERSYYEAKELVEAAGLEILVNGSVLARSNYRSIAGVNQKEIRGVLSEFLPSSLVNSLICLSDSVDSGKQWIMKVCRKKL